MKRSLLAVLVGLSVSGSAMAQQGAQPTPEQMQQAMLQQMQMMATMFDYRRSKLGFNETVRAIAAAAERHGWKLGQTHDVQAAMREAGATEGGKMKVVMACPSGFNEKLARAGQGKIPAHPCRFTVFEGRDGKSYVVKLNSALFAKGLQGEAGKLMGEIAADEEAILKGIAE